MRISETFSRREGKRNEGGEVQGGEVKDWCGKDILLGKMGLVWGGSNASGWIPYNARNFKIFSIHFCS